LTPVLKRGRIHDQTRDAVGDEWASEIREDTQPDGQQRGYTTKCAPEIIDAVTEVGWPQPFMNGVDTVFWA
jgi:hypothetical protein